jgi:hypothetical protein
MTNTLDQMRKLADGRLGVSIPSSTASPVSSPLTNFSSFGDQLRERNKELVRDESIPVVEPIKPVPLEILSAPESNDSSVPKYYKVPSGVVFENSPRSYAELEPHRMCDNRLLTHCRVGCWTRYTNADDITTSLNKFAGYGYVYFLKIADQLSKMGFSTDPKSRLAAHITNADNQLGITINKQSCVYWVSPHHCDAEFTETMLFRLFNHYRIIAPQNTEYFYINENEFLFNLGFYYNN